MNARAVGGDSADSGTGEPVMATLAVMVSVPLTKPGGAIGENTTVMVQVAVATVRVPVQVPPTLE